MTNAALLCEKVRDIYADPAWLESRMERIADEAALRIESRADMAGVARPLSAITIGRDHVFPGPILLDLKTGSYFTYSLSLPAGDEDARSRNLKGSELLVGTYVTRGEHQNGAVIANAQGFNGYEIGIARKALGEDRVDEIIQAIERGTYFSPDMLSRLFSDLAGKSALIAAVRH
ncbi:MAG: hypothetical protein H6865_00690 [Rhodospirillales bacterium]|nr:hypothetical protein [Alphaproteobacteria bacterium]MCB9986144.1 hypothetical protein [Rhodospirillales bacterium]USO07297.1 MAG: hypothetical protein H6866_07685 [Rhodospirillales bacterium]